MKNTDSLLDILVQSHKQVEKKIKQTSANDLFDEHLVLDDRTVIKKDLEYGLIDWLDVKTRKGFMSKPVDAWSNSMLFKYLKYGCIKKDPAYKDIIETQIGIARISSLIKEMKQNYALVFSKEPDNFELKAYVEYFVDVEIDKYILQHGKFSIYSIRNKYILKNYQEFRNKISTSSTAITINEEEEFANKQVKKLVSFEDLEVAYEAGGYDILTEYGIVHTIDFLYNYKKLNLGSALKVVERFYKDAQHEDKNSVESINELTVMYGPYKSSMNIDEVVCFLRNVKCKNVVFST